MRIAVNQGAGARSATKMHVRTSGGTMEIVRASIRGVDGLKQFFASLKIKLSSTSVIGRGNSATTLTVPSAPVTATVEGAVGTASHNWTRTDGGAQPWTIDDPTSAETTFSTDCDQGERFSATFIDTVTDQGGQVLASDTVTVDCANIYYAGGFPGAFGTPGVPYP